MRWAAEDIGASVGGSGAHAAAFDARDVAAQVAADMNAAFANWVDVASGPTSARVRRRRFGPGDAGPSPKRSRLNLVTAVSVGVLVGVSVGALLARPPHRAAPRSSQASVDGSSTSRAAVGVVPASTPAQERYLRVETIPTPAAAAPGVRSALSYPPIRSSPPTTAAPSALPYPHDSSSDGDWSGDRALGWNASPSARPLSRVAPAYRHEEWPARLSASSPPDAGSGPPCFGQAGERRRDCLIAASSAADSQLRVSYRQAAMAGVSNDVLEGDTQSWNALRWRGGSDLEQMIVGYRRLSATLHAQAAAARRERTGRVSRYVPGVGYDQDPVSAQGASDGWADRSYSPW